MVWIIKATEEVLESLGQPILDGEMYEHFFKENIALVDKQFCYRFFRKRGFEDVTPDFLRRSDPPSGKVLIMRWGGLGDALLASCFIEGLKEVNSEIEIYWVGSEDLSALFANNPHVASQLSILPHEVGMVMDQFDQMYDITHAIECNSDATYTNPYDMIASWTGIPLPKEVHPYLYHTEDEIDWGKRYLKDVGFDFSRPIIGLAVEASAPRRTWPVENSIDLANRLNKEGMQVILFGVYNRVDLKNSPGILNTVGTIRNIRVAASLIRMCDLIIAPFTGLLHLSQAFGYKPLLILAGPWDGSTEAKYYPNAHTIQGQYKCAPCFRLGGQYDVCEKNDKDGIGLCMKAITVNEVFDEAVKILRGKPANLYSPRVITHRSCPAGCKAKTSIYTAYGKYFYLKCSACKSVFINKLPDEMFYAYVEADKSWEDSDIKDASKVMNMVGDKLSADKIGPLRRVFEIGCGSGAFLYGCKKLGRLVSGIEISLGSSDKIREKYGMDVEEGDFDTWGVPLEHIGKYQAVVLRHVLEHVNDPFGALLKCNRLLADGGYVYVLAHDGAQLTGVSDVRRNYVMLGGNFPGEHVVIFSERGLAKLAIRAGFKLLDWKIEKDGTMHGLLARCSE